MKNSLFNYFLLLLLLFQIACTSGSESSAKSANERQYDAVRGKVFAERNSIDLLLEQLPATYRNGLRRDMASIQNNTYEGYKELNNLSDQDMENVLKGIESFFEKMEVSKAFKPNEVQRKMYAELKEKVVKERKVIEKFISKPSDPNDIQEVTSKNFLSKILRYDVDQFLAKSVITEEEYVKSITEFNDNWSVLLSSLAMFEANEKLEKMLNELK